MPPPTAPSASGSTSPQPPPHAQLALEIGLSVFGIFLIIGAVFTTLTFRRKFTTAAKHSSPVFAGVDANHPASHITPFRQRRGDNAPYAHIAGANMRIATRDTDGSWKISGPGTPFTPSGISDISPSPSSSTYHSDQPSPNQDVVMQSPPAKDGYDYHDESPKEFYPPPAYGYDAGYIDHGKA